MVAFDSGFVSYFRGWDSLRDEDRGELLEHLVLGEITARFGTTRLHYWRDKQKHEVDFVLEIGRRRDLLAIECKSSAAKFESSGLEAFRRKHPRGRNIVVTLRSTETHRRAFGDVEVEFVPYTALPAYLDALR
jgi:uncharacterized protein